MNENTRLAIIFSVILFAIMFIAHTISDYNAVTNAMKYCIVAKEGPETVRHE